jgi:hypothetical protein
MACSTTRLATGHGISVFACSISHHATESAEMPIPCENQADHYRLLTFEQPSPWPSSIPSVQRASSILPRLTKEKLEKLELLPLVHPENHSPDCENCNPGGSRQGEEMRARLEELQTNRAEIRSSSSNGRSRQVCELSSPTGPCYFAVLNLQGLPCGHGLVTHWTKSKTLSPWTFATPPTVVGSPRMLHGSAK